MKDEAAKLWTFAVELYDQEEVKATCLRIQARYGLAISLLLGTIWAGLQGKGRLGATELEEAIRRALEWHRDIIEPMRALRRQLRQPPSGVEDEGLAVRKQILEAELNAEQIEQQLFLQDLPPGLPVSPPSERWRDAAVNAALFMRKSCPRPEPEAQDALAQIIHAACPGTPFGDLYQAIESAWIVC